jgi:aldose 1-epimerase
MSIESIYFDERPMYRLSHHDESFIIDMNHGMTVVQYSHHGNEIIKYIKDRYLAGKTYGIPILFPTPNRISDGKYTFLETSYPGIEHGLVRQEPFHLVKLESTNDSTSISGSWELTPDHNLFAYYPWHCKLSVQVKLSRDSLQWLYSVENREKEKPLGFGFGLHPFFTLCSDTAIQVVAPSYMHASDSGYPNGERISVENSIYDLRKPVRVIDHILDTVYYDPDKPVEGLIQYRPDSVLTLTGSSEFKHFVVYTPKNAEFFCLENQSCSADTHNIYAKGYEKYSGLILVKAGCMHAGYITFRWHNFDTF